MKIICSDYDGTLNYGGITEKKLDAIRKWQESGNLFCVVSGRDRDFFFGLKEKNIPFDYYLACNGAFITDGNMGIVSDVRCEGAVAREITEYLFSLDCPFANICENTLIRVANEDFPEEKGISLKELREIEYFNQISTALSDFETASQVTKKIRERFGEYANPLQNGVCIDIVPAGLDKAQGIYTLLGVCSLERADVIAVGDNVNDEAMIREFYSYAMENGVDRIKMLADKITCSIEELIEGEIKK